ncbi:MAG TPA: hypothetical protein PLO52_03635 [Flavobacterium alvei]|nr:hypothetical protein [Flavobacterium alvei]HQK39191.1 hypothetical protein [Flavobacterium alvei]
MKKFTDIFITELNIEKKCFVDKFSNSIESSRIDFMSEFLNSLSLKKSNKKLIGKLKNDSFELKINSTMNILNYSTAVAKGIITDSKNGIKIETRIKGFDYRFIPLYIILSIVFIVSLIGLFTDFKFIFGLIISSGIFLFTMNNMLDDIQKLKIELTNEMKSISE